MLFGLLLPIKQINSASWSEQKPELSNGTVKLTRAYLTGAMSFETCENEQLNSVS